MGGVQFALQPGHCTLGAPARLRLVISQDFSGSMHHLAFRIQAEAGVRLAGSPQAQIAEISPHAPVSVDLSIHPRQAGAFALKLSRISARVGGQVVEFDDVTLPIEVLAAASFPADLLSITSAISQLDQGIQASIPIHAQNLGSLLLHNSVVRIEAAGCDPETLACALTDLPPGQVAEIEVVLTPKIAGAITLQVIIQAIGDGTPVECATSLRFTVRANQRAQETHYHGDIIQINRGARAGLNLHPAPSSSSSNTPTVTCPSCGESVPSDKFCCLCGQPLGRRE